MSRRPITMGIQQPTGNSSGPVPAMYDTSVSSNAASDSVSWSTPRSPRSGGTGGATPRSPRSGGHLQHQQQQQQHYSYFPKSHPNKTAGADQQQPASQASRMNNTTNSNNAPLTPTRGGVKQSQYTMMANPASSYVPKSPRSENGVAHYNNPSSYYAQQQQQTGSRAPMPQNQQQQYRMPTQQQQQQYPPTSPANVPSGGSQGGYRNDYSRSQHSAGAPPPTGNEGVAAPASVPSKANSEPIISEQDRFATYINRFSAQSQQQLQQQQQQRKQFGQGGNTQIYRGGAPNQQQQQQNAPSPNIASGRSSVASTGPPQNSLLYKAQQQQHQQQQKAAFRRQVSTTSSSGTVASSTGSTFSRSRQAQQHPEQIQHQHQQQYQQNHHQQQQLRASPPLSSYPDPELEAANDSRLNTSLDDTIETRTTASDGVRTTASAVTRRMGPTSQSHGSNQGVYPHQHGSEPTDRYSPMTAEQQPQAARGRMPGQGQEQEERGAIELTSNSRSNTPSRGRSPAQRTPSVDPSSRYNTPGRSRSRSIGAASHVSRGSATSAANTVRANNHTRYPNQLQQPLQQQPYQHRGRSPSASRTVESAVSGMAPASDASSSGPPVPAVSPGTNRTRNLAERFEQRMRSKGRSSQLNSAINSARSGGNDPNANVEEVPQYHPQQYEYEQPRGYSAEDQDEKKEPDDQRYMLDKLGNAVIETPDHATVKSLRAKLWDEKESLQVRVRPNTTLEENANNEAHLRGTTSEDEYDRHRQDHEQVAGRGRDLQPPPPDIRQTRSLSPRTSRKAYEGNVVANQQDSSQLPASYQYHSHQPLAPTISDVASSSGSTSSAALRFKSKFYEAAALAAPELGSQTGGSANDGNADADDNQVLGASANPYQQHSLHSANKSSWMKNSPVDDDQLAPSQATTAKINNAGEHISTLLEKLHSVNRGNPSQALMEIDEILKQEALKEDQTQQRALRVPDAEHYMKYRAIQKDKKDNTPERKQEDDDESDGDTTVSSITNPTYQGAKKLDETEDEAEAQERVKDMEIALQNRSTGVVDVLGGHATENLHHPMHQEDKRAPRSTVEPQERSFKPIGNDFVHPPMLISAKERPDVEDPRTNSVEKMEQQSRVEHVPIQPVSPAGHGGVDNANSDELAQKIRRWDELTGKDAAAAAASPYNLYGANKATHSPVSAGEVVSSHADESEALGSILTPLDPSGASTKARNHPWDSSPAPRPSRISTRDTSMDNGDGIEAVSTSPYPTSNGRRPSPQNVLNISNDLSNGFDDAWVALPTSRFFPSSTSPTPQQQEERAVVTPEAAQTYYPVVDETERSRGSPSRGQSRESISRRSRYDEGIIEKPADVENDSPARGQSREPSRRSRYDDLRMEDSTSANEESNSPARGQSREPSRRSRYDEGRIEESPSGNVESRGSSRRESSTKPKRGLRALLQRGRSEKTPVQNHASASVSTSIVGSGRRANAPIEQEEEAPPPRGRKNLKASESSRSRSLEERRVRNPNIARKFSRMLRVYGDDDNGHI
eukprot:CAMPEP_0172454030 /NCGR_PEP_ID=MMETSP1065-20121228/11135_1 /TAXON_ID=265537 /ORGANISM="Amphiprora paludosa, Strain CCMP125" /LENGTH=1520 /DNA_ID=CAMNT_0013206289 /DNA_START=261 /DNA_END=4823 /DNA_ORIENTATION=+